MLNRMKYIEPCIKVAAFSSSLKRCHRITNHHQTKLAFYTNSCVQPSGNNHLVSLSLQQGKHQSLITQLFSTQVDAVHPNSNNNEESQKGGSISNDNDDESPSLQEFASSYHAPVMWKECIDALLKRSHNEKSRKHKNKYKVDDESEDQSEIDELTKRKERPRVFIDGTLGGGGHSLHLLQNLSPGDIVIGCDVDPSAIATASIRLNEYIVDHNGKLPTADKPIFIPVNSNFKDLEYHVKALKHPLTRKLILYDEHDDDDDNNNNVNVANTFLGVDGILLDLGVSSHQIDNAERGFAFMKDGPLDMRMFGGEFNNYDSDAENKGIHDDNEASYKDYVNVADKNINNAGGLTAADICNEFGEEEISRILKKYGDEPRSRKIAGSIVASRPLSTTGDLKEAVAKVTPVFVKKSRRHGLTATLARVFQSFRIVVNDEDGVLREAFEDMAPSLMAKGGRLVILTYHSMEDRAAKRVIRDGKVGGQRQRVETDMYGNTIFTKDSSPWRALGKKQKATEEEVIQNSRARSATLRVAEKLQKFSP